jgi:hypothetical protein
MFIKPVGTDGKMHQNAIERIRYVRIYFFQIGQAVMKNDVPILGLQSVDGGVGLPEKIRQKQIPLAGQIDQDVADTEQIIPIDVLPVAIVEIEIDPSVIAAFAVDQDMVPPDLNFLLNARVMISATSAGLAK